MKKKFANLTIAVKEKDAALSQIRAVFSTGDVDRHEEVVDQRGWDLAEFMLNPVVLWSHDSQQPAIGKVVSLGFVDGNLEGVIQFAAKEYGFAQTIYNLMAGGYINAISVGFINTEWSFDQEEDMLTLLKNKLLEVSVVNIPANALALAKSKGVDVSLYEKRGNRANEINDKILGKEAGQEDVEKPDDAEKKPPEVAPNEGQPAPKPGEDATQEPKDAGETSEEEAAKALQTLAKASNETVRAAVKVLEKNLNAAKPSHQRSNVGGQKEVKYSVSQINRLVRSLIKAKS